MAGNNPLRCIIRKLSTKKQPEAVYLSLNTGQRTRSIDTKSRKLTGYMK